MEVILLERVAKLGQMGETVKVRDGFARNFLLPQGKALRATGANKKRFDDQRAQLEARNLEQKAEAEKVHANLDGQSFVIIRQAGESGQLYGSVSPRDIADAASADTGIAVHRNHIELNTPIKTIGIGIIAQHRKADKIVLVDDETVRRGKGKGIAQTKRRVAGVCAGRSGIPAARHARSQRRRLTGGVRHEGIAAELRRETCGVVDKSLRRHRGIGEYIHHVRARHDDTAGAEFDHTAQFVFACIPERIV